MSMIGMIVMWVWFAVVFAIISKWHMGGGAIIARHTGKNSKVDKAVESSQMSARMKCWRVVASSHLQCKKIYGGDI